MMTIQEFINYIKGSTFNNCLWHFTDEANLPSIYEHGILSTTERKIRNITPHS